MSISKIDRVVLNPAMKNELDSKVSQSQLQNAITDLENQINNVYSNIVRKITVSTFADLRIQYPNAQEGWTATVDDTNITYQYDADNDVWFATSINAIPKATHLVDGLQAKEDKTKLDTIETGAEVNPSAPELLVLIKTVDGVNSGLDADTFQGNDPSAFAPSVHDHDGRYNTKTEITTLLNNKSDVSHVHLTYVHNQIASSTTWAIDHNLGKRPSVMIVDSAGSVVIGDISYTSDNQITLSFSAPFSGSAYLN